MCTRAPVITALFATCGVSVWTFLVAAFLSLPKQFATVYLGYAENASADGKPSRGTTVIKIVVIALTVVVTVVAMRYINARIDAVKGRVVYARRKARCVPSPFSFLSLLSLWGRLRARTLTRATGRRSSRRPGRAPSRAPRSPPTPRTPRPPRS